MLDGHHISYLTDERTLEKWSGKSLSERSALFSAAFPDKRIAVTTLRRLYLRHGIKRKRVVLAKVIPPRHAESYQTWQRIIMKELAEADRTGLPVLFLDETNFTKASLQTREWSCQLSNLSVDQKEVYTGYRSVIATMTAERGIGLCLVHPKAVAAEDFVPFLRKLRTKLIRRPIALFMDNLWVHKCRDVQPEYSRLDIM